jgi:hypothetical protein
VKAESLLLLFIEPQACQTSTAYKGLKNIFKIIFFTLTLDYLQKKANRSRFGKNASSSGSCEPRPPPERPPEEPPEERSPYLLKRLSQEYPEPRLPKYMGLPPLPPPRLPPRVKTGSRSELLWRLEEAE